MSKSLAISSTDFKADACVGANMVFSTSIRSLNAAIDAALLNLSWRVSRGPPAMDRPPWTPCLAFFAGGGVDIVRCA